MSRGMGRIQRAILDYLNNHHSFEPCELSWLARQVHEAIHGKSEDLRPPRSFVVSVRRAVNDLERKGLVMSGYCEGDYNCTSRRYYALSRSCSALVKYVWTPETTIKDGWCSYINRDAARADRDAFTDAFVTAARAWPRS